MTVAAATTNTRISTRTTTTSHQIDIVLLLGPSLVFQTDHHARRAYCRNQDGKTQDSIRSPDCTPHSDQMKLGLMTPTRQKMLIKSVSLFLLEKELKKAVMMMMNVSTLLVVYLWNTETNLFVVKQMHTHTKQDIDHHPMSSEKNRWPVITTQVSSQGYKNKGYICGGFSSEMKCMRLTGRTETEKKIKSNAIKNGSKGSF